MRFSSTYDLFHAVCAERPDAVAYRYKHDGRWIDVTCAQTRSTVGRIAKALIAMGVAHGDRVCILSDTRLEWVQADLGIISCGGVTVGIYQSNISPDCAYIVQHCDAEVLFVENAEQLEKILPVRAELPRLRRIVMFEGRADGSDSVIGWNEFLQGGEAISDAALEERGKALGPDDLASLVYTSGTTGVPKGVMLTHGNLVFTVDSICRCLPMKQNWVTLGFLPLAHVYARLIAYCCLRQTVTVAFAEHFTKIPENLREVRPHFIACVPRVYEKFHAKVLSSVEAAGGLKPRLFEWSLRIGLQAAALELENKPVPRFLGIKRAIADRLVLGKIRAAFGGRIIYGVSGAAPLNPEIALFFHACGVLILEGIGMTENSSFSNVNRVDDNRFGTVGKIGPGIEMKIAEDGEVLFRGPNNMKGYFKNPEATAETIDADGWLHSGDIGEIDPDGFLKITDRKKDLIITAGGKNVAPQLIERILRNSRFIAQAVACGDRRKFISALITLEVENVLAWAVANGKGSLKADQLATDPDVNSLVQNEIDRLNRQLASHESVKRFHILPRDFSIETGELTPTLKIKRKVVKERYQREIAAMY